MTEQSFSLIPFYKSRIPSVQIDGHVSRQNGRLHIQYILTGETEKIFLPQRSITPQRKHELWSATCFEFFLARPAQPQYWEFNISPSGDWNVYHMDAYRRVGFREETTIQRLQFEFMNDATCVTLNTDVELSLLISEADQVRLGISCVIQGIDRHQTYWALTHPHPMPDFHVRESFLIHL